MGLICGEVNRGLMFPGIRSAAEVKQVLAGRDADLSQSGSDKAAARLRELGCAEHLLRNRRCLHHPRLTRDRQAPANEPADAKPVADVA